MENLPLKEIRWPLSFQIDSSKSSLATQSQRNWSHELYRGPNDQPVKVLYSRTKEDSEKIAQEFLNEPILGFDMEWNWWIKRDADAPLQERIGLIQLACEDKIGLFHIGLHQGTTSEDLLAATLCRIIEEPTIVKTGVNIVGADFSRLRQWFGLDPQGAFELSHLHNLITYGGIDPSKCTRKLFRLDQHVETHLGLVLPKGDERMSRWNLPLSIKQKSYAAADAYAGFMLYHCMNAKRLEMLPLPPLPIHADKYTGTDRGRLLQLQSNNEDGTTVTVAEFFQPASPIEQRNGDDKLIVEQTPTGKRRKSASRTPQSNKTAQQETQHPFADMDTIFSKRLFEKLRAHRSTIAKQRGCSSFIVAHNTHLHDISRKCPTTEVELLKIKGVGKGKVSDYGQAWLDLVNAALQELQSLEVPGPPWKDMRPFDMNGETSNGVQPITLHHLTKTSEVASEMQTPSVHEKQRLPPSLHTGLSFSIANTKLDDNSLEGLLSASDSRSDSSSAFEDDTRSPSPSRRKRKLERD